MAEQKDQSEITSKPSRLSEFLLEVLKKRDFSQILSSDMKLGFELEFIHPNEVGTSNLVNTEAIAKDVSDATGIEITPKGDSTHWKIGDGYILSTDYKEVTDDWEQVYQYELITPPLPAKLALDNLEKIFSAFTKFGYITKTKSGFHVNVEIPDIDKFDPVKLYAFASVSDAYTLKTLSRSGLRVVSTIADKIRELSVSPIHGTHGKPISIETIKTLLTNSNGIFKASSVYVRTKDPRIGKPVVEFRMLGGENYHTKFELIRKNIIRNANMINIACDPLRYVKEYEKYLATLLETIKKGETEYGV